MRSPGGRTRLLFLAAELLRLMDAAPPASGPSAAPAIPMQGRLRSHTLYLPTKSEFLVGPILQPLGEVKWQPQGAGHGADYRVTHASGVLVAEVKRVRSSDRHERSVKTRLRKIMGRSGPLFTA